MIFFIVVYFSVLIFKFQHSFLSCEERIHKGFMNSFFLSLIGITSYSQLFAAMAH